MVIASLIAATLLAPPAESIYDFSMKSIEGKPVRLRKFKGKVLVVVNVASRCGLTPQYEGLQSLYAKYKKQGLVVLGFPSNNFGGQEPGTDEEIAAFCATNYQVSFPMFSKISVKGEETHPLYKWLIAQGKPDDIQWNFEKFVVGRDGKSVTRFSPRVKPTDDAFVKAVEAELAKS